MQIRIASRQSAELHRYLSVTGQQFNNHINYAEGNYVTDRYNCRNLFLKVQSYDELRESLDKPCHALMALQRTRGENVFYKKLINTITKCYIHLIFFTIFPNVLL